jgi:hypothetical protein
MNKIELSPDGYERIEEKLQALADAVNGGIFGPETAAQFLLEAARRLRDLRETLNDVLLLVPEAPGPAARTRRKGAAMIASWKDFFNAVEQMRQCQIAYFRTKAPSALLTAKKCEAAVDACIEEKRAEWARQKQPDLL